MSRAEEKQWILTLGGGFIVGVLLFSPWFKQDVQANPSTEYLKLEIHQDSVSIHAREIKLSHILGEVAQQSGIVIVLDPEADRIRSLDLRDIPLETTLKHLLVGVSYAALWQRQSVKGGPDRVVLTKLFVYPEGKSGPGRDSLVYGRATKKGSGLLLNTQGGDEPSDRVGGLAAYLGRKPGQIYWEEKQERMGLEFEGKKAGDIGIDWEMKTYVKRKKEIRAKSKP